jgi:hypothetical protein
MLKEASKQFLQKIKTIILILLGTVSWSLTMVKSGIGFWGANGHDGIWHIALSESLARGSFNMPTFAGEALKNYHIGFDLLLALFHKVTTIPIPTLYFQIIPPILALLVGILTYKFVLNWTKSDRSAWWSTFFVYFGGSFGFLIGKGESAFWSQQAISTLINPPFALSLIFLLTGLIFLQKLEKKNSFWNYLICILSFGLLIEIKAYAGVLALGGLFAISLWKFAREKKLNIFFVFLGSLALSLLVYLPLNKNAGGLITWQPFWFLETMMGLTDRVGWLKFSSAMATYKSGHIWVKGLLAYMAAFGIFILGNFGTRMIFLFRKIRFDEISIFIYSIIGAGIIIPTLFLQKGTPWNTIQFFYYSLFFSGILAGVAIDEFFSKPKHSVSMIRIVGTSLVLLTIPTTLITLKDVYIPSRPPAILPSDEIQALKFLSDQPQGVVLTYPFNSILSKEAEANPPRPLYLYTSTAYVSAFSAHPTYLEDEINLNITGYDWEIRLLGIESWYKESKQEKSRAFLKDNSIKYIYWLKGQRALLGEGQLGIKNIYENSSVTIYQVE